MYHRPLPLGKYFHQKPKEPFENTIDSLFTNFRKEPVSRSNGTRRGSPSEYVSSRRNYESSIESSRKEPSSHSSRDKSGKDSSR